MSWPAAAAVLSCVYTACATTLRADGEPGGAIPELAVRNGLSQQSNEVLACMKQFGVSEGALEVRFVVEPDGSVSSAQILASTWTEGMNACFRDVVLALHLPSPGSFPQVISHRFDVGSPAGPPPPPNEADVTTARERERAQRKALGSAPPVPPAHAHVGLPRDLIAGVVESHREELSRCLDVGIVRVTLRFVINHDGSVLRTVAVYGHVSQPLATCIEARVREWTFPPPGGGAPIPVEFDLDLGSDTI
jgi:hypothetical protein